MVKSPFEYCSRNSETNLFAVLVWGIPRQRNLRHVKPELRPHVRSWIILKRDDSAVFFPEIRKGDGR
jgi:hypothetical protein